LACLLALPSAVLFEPALIGIRCFCLRRLPPPAGRRVRSQGRAQAIGTANNRALLCRLSVSPGRLCADDPWLVCRFRIDRAVHCCLSLSCGCGCPFSVCLALHRIPCPKCLSQSVCVCFAVCVFSCFAAQLHQEQWPHSGGSEWTQSSSGPEGALCFVNRFKPYPSCSEYAPVLLHPHSV
jgi:hypothetical protein